MGMNKTNIKQYWWQYGAAARNIVSIDSTVAYPTIWKASGHVDAFNVLIDSRDSRNVIVPMLIETSLPVRWQDKQRSGQSCRRFGEAFDEASVPQYQRSCAGTPGRVFLHERFSRLWTIIIWTNSSIILTKMFALSVAQELDGRQFDLMFSTDEPRRLKMPAKRHKVSSPAFQITLNVLQKTGRMKIPFGIAQIRLSVTKLARQFIFVCASSSRWKCSSLWSRVQSSWFKSWKILAWNGTRRWAGDDHCRYPRPRQTGPLR